MHHIGMESIPGFGKPPSVSKENGDVQDSIENVLPTSHDTRTSTKSLVLYGPQKSVREGRPDYLQSVISQRKRVDIFGSIDEEEGEDGGTEEVFTTTSTGPLSNTEEEEEEERKRKARLHHHLIIRISSVARIDPTNLIQVSLKNVTYSVPYQLDKHSKTTVINQSVCYFTYEFFRRLYSLLTHCLSSQSNPEQTASGKRKRYHVKDFTSLFVPFENLPVLHNINLVFKPGKTYLVLGPPGSGKTSLLKAISGRLPNYEVLGGGEVRGKPHLSGRVEYNGVAIQDNSGLIIPNIVSFVGQLDVHAPYLTVKETFEFASACRNDISQIQTNKTLESLTIEGLGLKICEDTFVGNTNIRGVSGGQRRRVSVGEMMQGNNPVACCDEMSTGLDAAVTHDIVKSIVDYSRAAKTTRVISLLQPGPETFALFDEVVVLCEGMIAYSGPVEEAVDYFASLGYELPPTVDVADFLQTVTTAEGALLFEPKNSPRDEHYSATQFAEAFMESKYGSLIEQQLQAPPTNNWKELGVPKQYKNQFSNSWVRSFKLNFNRHLLLWWRDKGFIIGKTAENIGMSATTGGILFQQARIPSFASIWDSKNAEALQLLQDGINSALFMTCLHILLGTTTSAPQDLDERPIHYKHGDASFYQTSAYVLGKLAASLPQRILETVSFSIPLYFLVGLDSAPSSFFLFLTIVLVYTFTLKLLYAIFTQFAPNQQNVLSFGTFLVLLFALFSGFIVYPNVIPGYYYWFLYANPVFWAYQALLLTELTSSKYSPSAAKFLSARGFHYTRQWIGYSFAFFIPYALLCAVLFVFVLKTVRIEPIRSGISKDINNEEEKTNEREEFNFSFTKVDLTFEDIVYKVKASTGNEMLRLLNGVSGVFQGGRMCALMGSSGAGKTTLMDVIALRKTSGVIEGEVRLNGFLQERVSFLRSSGYVEQFDVQQSELTVKETVEFSAQLRLLRNNPITATNKGRLQFVDYVLEMMELTSIAELQVGSYEEGGLTFEQRKRLAIAVELAASPSILFLDEPTSGLDSRGALIVMRALKKIASTGRAVCATIHQPSSAVFEMFDDLLLLKQGGEAVFFGELGQESCHLVDYFEARGAQPIEYGENPAAWMLNACMKKDYKTNWKDQFLQSEQYRAMRATISSVRGGATASEDSKRITFSSVYATSALTRQYLMIRRVTKIMMRSHSYNLARIIIAIIYSLVIGLVLLDFGDKKKSLTQDAVDGYLSTIFWALTVIGVVSINMAVPVMKQIRDVFYKHRASGMLSHNSVCTAVTLGEIPFICILSVIFSSIYYSLTGGFHAVNRFFMFFLYFSLNVGVYTYFGQAFICLVRDISTAAALVGALIGFNLFFSGLIVRPQNNVMFLIGFWTAPGRYVYEGVVTSQFHGEMQPVIATPYMPYWFSLNCTNPQTECEGTLENYVNFFFSGHFSINHQWLDISVLIFCLVLARLLLWLSLWKFNYGNT